MNARTAKRLGHLVVARLLNDTGPIAAQIDRLRFILSDDTEADRRAIKKAVAEIQEFHTTLSRTEARR